MAGPFPIEFTSELPYMTDELKSETERRLTELAQGHTDITGAAVAIREPAHTSTPFIYEARVVVYFKLENVAATEQADSMEVALRTALRAVERQVRELRGRIGKPWKKHGSS